MKALGVVVDKVELKKMITDVDADGSGSVEFPEFLQMMTAKMGSSDSKELRKVAKELGENLTDDELQSMLEHADKSNLGYVSMDDFYRLMKKKSNNTIDDLLGDD